MHDCTVCFTLIFVLTFYFDRSVVNIRINSNNIFFIDSYYYLCLLVKSSKSCDVTYIVQMINFSTIIYNNTTENNLQNMDTLQM